LDLGSGNGIRRREGYDEYGVDIFDRGDPRIKVADLATDPIPYSDNEFELVTAHDFMEHIPFSMYVCTTVGRMDSLKGAMLEHKMVKRDCMILLFDEIYRVIKDGGEFFMSSPCYPHQSVFQDPTHKSFLTTDTIYYFSGDYFGWHDHYGHKSRFELIDRKVENGHIQNTLKAIKHLPADSPYLLHY